MIGIALNVSNLKTNIEYYTTHDPNPNDQLEVAYVVHLFKVRGMMCAMEADDNFLAKQLVSRNARWTSTRLFPSVPSLVACL